MSILAVSEKQNKIQIGVRQADFCRVRVNGPYFLRRKWPVGPEAISRETHKQTIRFLSNYAVK